MEMYMRDSGLIIRHKVKEHTPILMVLNIKVNGKMIFRKDMV
jgi:hypothetical protein